MRASGAAPARRIGPSLRGAAAGSLVALGALGAWATWSPGSDDALPRANTPVRESADARTAAPAPRPAGDVAPIEQSRVAPPPAVEARVASLAASASPLADRASPLPIATRTEIEAGPPPHAAIVAPSLPPGIRAQDVEVNAAGVVTVVRQEPAPGAPLPATDGVGFGAAATPERLRSATSSAP